MEVGSFRAHSLKFTIADNRVNSVEFIVGLKKNKTIVLLPTPLRDCPESNQPEARVIRIFKHIFDKVLYSPVFHLWEIDHGSYYENTLFELKKVVSILLKNSEIDAEKHDNLIDDLEKMVTKIQIKFGKKALNFEEHLSSFNKNISTPYRHVKRNKDLRVLAESGISSDNSIDQLDNLIFDIKKHHGDFMRIDSRWVYLFLSEGALEHLIKSLDLQKHNETKKRLEALYLGIKTFLIKYESEIHVVVKQKITSSAEWFQKLYETYESMVKTGEPPSKVCYVQRLEGYETPQLFLTRRFVRS